MKRFSGIFWFTVIAGTLSSVLLSGELLSLLSTRLDRMTALCGRGIDACSSESMQDAFRLFCIAELAGNLSLFWAAHLIGRSFIKPAPPAVTAPR
jgi:hypothetical protein